MGAAELGPWRPMPLDRAVERFLAADFRWWVTGGHALELHLGRSWRHHDDIDLSICRQDAPRVRNVLADWDLHVAAAGALEPWDGRPLDGPSEDNVWCRPTPDSPWALDLTISDGDDHDWIYRRDPRIRRPWGEAILTTGGGTPYLAPELQLLFKSTDARPKDDVDAETVIPRLGHERQAWLAERLPPQHDWLVIIGDALSRSRRRRPTSGR